MVAKKPQRPSLFALAERQIIALYDAGVMSPAVLNHVLAAYADSGIDWNDEGALQTVDGHTVHEAVVLVMMPERALKSARKDFMSVVEHLAASEPEAVEDQTEDAEDDEDLLVQLGGNTKRTTRAKKTTKPAEPKRAAFNPLVGARAVKGNKR
ncbi:hypothetical protein AWB80_02791 [Caballeronia pedi]|uniref:Uncharacterized protein n=1 Tax=Caballeronia pedi TaxID=1777141 RepID=A0A158AYD1_9BURK|nr:hypothetical protein [Caballeronia pedi]SAK62854.1 hypothetical protein AWB80_02791 [Caballeronia pedi]